jgi:CheY-like chemotaxis protein
VPCHSRHHVLFADDSPDTVEAVATLLALHDIDVTSAAGGRDTLDKLLLGGLRPCVVLLDLRMPDMDGWAVWEVMQSHRELAQIPVVVVSGDIYERGRARELGVHEFLTKPVEPADLVAAVTRHCGLARVVATG